VTPTIVPRNEIGLVNPKRVIYMTRFDGLVVHYSAGRRARNRAEAIQRIRDIQRFHMETRGWSDIAYNFLVDDEGTIYEGRGWGVVGGHTAGHNSRLEAVCAMLNAGDEPTEAMLRSIRWLANERDRRHGRTGTRTVHSDHGNTSCAGAPLNAWVRAGMPVKDPAPVAPPAPVDPAAVRRWVAGVVWANLGEIPRRALVKNGTSSGAARAVQQALNIIAGAGLAENGVFGPISTAKLANYQRFFGLKVDGVAGPATVTHMQAILARIRDGRA
jgi:hypothetical protein